MLASPMRHPIEIKAGDLIASYWTPQNVQKVEAVRICNGKACATRCLAPTIHVQTDQGEVRFGSNGFTNGYAWSKVTR